LLKAYQRDIALLDKEKSELTTQLIEAENSIEKMKYESKVDFEGELESYRKKYIEYELKFNDKLGETQRLQSALDQKARRLVERETVLNAMEAKLAEINEQNQKLNAAYKESSSEQIELQRKLCSVLVEKEAVMKGE
jgi:hypothetical protein